MSTTTSNDPFAFFEDDLSTLLNTRTTRGMAKREKLRRNAGSPPQNRALTNNSSFETPPNTRAEVESKEVKVTIVTPSFSKPSSVISEEASSLSVTTPPHNFSPSPSRFTRSKRKVREISETPETVTKSAPRKRKPNDIDNHMGTPSRNTRSKARAKDQNIISEDAELFAEKPKKTAVTTEKTKSQSMARKFKVQNKRLVQYTNVSKSILGTIDGQTSESDDVIMNEENQYGELRDFTKDQANQSNEIGSKTNQEIDDERMDTINFDKSFLSEESEGQPQAQDAQVKEDDSDDFEEVEIFETQKEEIFEPQDYYGDYTLPEKLADETIEITVSTKAIKSRGVTKMDRLIRTETHKIHVLSLIGHGLIRNKWCNDRLAQCLALSLIPPDLFSQFDTKFCEKEKLTIEEWTNILQPLCLWWKGFFNICRPGILSREYNEFGVLGVVTDEEKSYVDWIPSIQAFRMCFKEGRGSKDTSAQLFVTLLRALGIPARLIISLQAVPFKFSAKKPVANKKSAVRKTVKTEKKQKTKASDEITGDNMETKTYVVTTAKRGRRTSPTRARKKSNTEESDLNCVIEPERVSKYFTKPQEKNADETLSKYFAASPKAYDDTVATNSANSNSSNQKGKAPQDRETDSDDVFQPPLRRFSLRSRTRNQSPKAIKMKIEISDDEDESENESDQHSDFEPSSKFPLSPKPLRQTSSIKREKQEDEEYELSVSHQNKFPTQHKRSGSKVKLKVAKADFEVEPPPVYWCEVYSGGDKKWFCIDPIRAILNNPQTMEPASSATDNIIAYVVAFEEDLYIKDVTRRYASRWGAHTRKLRIPATKDGIDWWKETLNVKMRPYETEQDKLEDTELLSSETMEAIPTTIGPFNNHPLYALERHIKKFEILHPKEPILGYIRNEPIFPRECVKPLHTVETWLKEGRQIKEGEQPMKHVKSRAVTLTKKKLAKMAELYDEPPRESGLYAEWQTEPYQPKPVVNGKIPKNTYGNVDLFKPNMCPIGAVHIPIHGISKIAKQLDIDFAEAVIGFEFHCNRCIPTVGGIVVAQEHEEMVRDAWREYSENVAVEKEKKRVKVVLGRWRKLFIKMRIKLRVQEQFAEEIMEPMESEESEFDHDGDDSFSDDMAINNSEKEKTNVTLFKENGESSKFAGGFLREVDEDGVEC
ncbi:hypothetical protein G9A89_023450 [Geosiphon pyriformis]|nr:hypothetical protein G9A89_023450 [Geosiphon pyriformis]